MRERRVRHKRFGVEAIGKPIFFLSLMHRPVCLVKMALQFVSVMVGEMAELSTGQSRILSSRNAENAILSLAFRGLREVCSAALTVKK